MKKTYQIRYNTKSKDDLTSWRLICDEKEILVSEVQIMAETFTTKNYVKELGEYKYHISCTGNLVIKDNVAYITNTNEKSSVKRHILKTISYRLLSTTIMILTTYMLGMDLKISAIIGVGELAFKPIIYFIHERFWYKYISIGRKK